MTKLVKDGQRSFELLYLCNVQRDNSKRLAISKL